MAVVWTESFSSFVPAGTGWQNYDIFTNKSVPKGAIAYIVCSSVNDAADRTVGVRTDGSSLDRYINLHEAEGGGSTNAGMYVKVDSSTGYIETYCSSTTGITFYLLGYWTGVDFTEGWEGSGFTPGWNTISYGSGLASKVAAFVLYNSSIGTARYAGVRAVGSSLDRRILLHESEGGSLATTAMGTVCAKCNSSGQAQVYAEYIDGVNFSDAQMSGFFDSTMDYTELAPTAGAISSANTWTDMDCTAYLDQDGRVVDTYCMHSSSNAEINVGARKNGSSLARYILEHEAESNNYAGYGCPTETDGSGIIEFYCGSASAEYVGILGYYIPAIVTQLPRTFCVIIG